jgi:hypothetical protein
LSEATNARAVWYSLAQIVVLVATCAWQLRHLKVCIFNFRNCYEILIILSQHFFEDRKMR